MKREVSKEEQVKKQKLKSLTYPNGLFLGFTLNILGYSTHEMGTCRYVCVCDAYHLILRIRRARPCRCRHCRRLENTRQQSARHDVQRRSVCSHRVCRVCVSVVRRQRDRCDRAVYATNSQRPRRHPDYRGDYTEAKPSAQG